MGDTEVVHISHCGLAKISRRVVFPSVTQASMQTDNLMRHFSLWRKHILLYLLSKGQHPPFFGPAPTEYCQTWSTCTREALYSLLCLESSAAGQSWCEDQSLPSMPASGSKWPTTREYARFKLMILHSSRLPVKTVWNTPLWMISSPPPL